MICKICNQKAKQIFTAHVLNKYDISYFYCEHCGFLQTEEPYWLDEAYKDSINISDTGYIQRNILLSEKLTVLLSLFFDKNGKFLDYAGGYGVFVRMMRDVGFDFYWDDKYTTNLFARGFECQNGLCLNPTQTFVENIGHDCSGVHCGESCVFNTSLSMNKKVNFDVNIGENNNAIEKFKLFYKKNTSNIFERLANKIKWLLK